MSLPAAERVVNRLKLRQLRLLVEAERHGSIVAAARALNLSQPAATKMMQDLELDFGVTLFERTNRGVVPTPCGAALVRQSKLLFAQVSAAVQELEDLAHGKGGRVVVGTLLAASARLLPAAIERLIAARPGLAVKVVEGTNEVLMPALRAGELDLVVGRLPVHRHRSDLDQITLTRETIVAVARPGHPLAGRKGLDLPDLARFGWVMPPPETTLRRQIDQLFANRGVDAPALVVESVSYLTNRALVAASDMVWPLPRQAVEADLAAGALAALGWEAPVGAGPVGVTLRRDGGLSPAARALVEALQAAAGSRPATG